MLKGESHVYSEEEYDLDWMNRQGEWTYRRIAELAREAGYPDQWEMPASDLCQLAIQAEKEWAKLPEETRTQWMNSAQSDQI